MPRLPVLAGSTSRIARPAFVSVQRARHDLAAPGADHRATVGLLVVGGAHHVDLALEPEQRARERERRAPLARAGLGGEPGDALLAVVEGLRHRRVGLVAARRADALVLVEDAAARPERRLQPQGAVEGGRPPHRVDLADGVGDRDPALAADLLEDEGHREEGREVVRPDRLPGARVERGRRQRRQVGRDVVPPTRDRVLGQDEAPLGHRKPPSVGVTRGPSLPWRGAAGRRGGPAARG